MSYLEVQTGGFNRADTTIMFYTRSNALLEPQIYNYGINGEPAYFSQPKAAWRSDQVVHYPLPPS